jgi:hypothetical protein
LLSLSNALLSELIHHVCLHPIWTFMRYPISLCSRPLLVGRAPNCTCIDPVAQSLDHRTSRVFLCFRPIAKTISTAVLFNQGASVQALVPRLRLHQAQRQSTAIDLTACFAWFVLPHTWHCLALAFRSSITPTEAQHEYYTVLACLYCCVDCSQLHHSAR